MQKFIKNLIVFLSITTFLYITATILIGLYVPNSFNLNLLYPFGSHGFMNTRMKEAKKVKDIDILFLGSSHAYRSFDPEVFSQYNIKTFNLGSSGQTPLQTEVLIDKYLTQLNPKIVIWDVYPVTFELDGVESAVDIIANDDIDYYTIKMVCKTNDIKAYNALVYGLFRQFFHLNDNFIEITHTENETYVRNTGFVKKKLSYISTFEKQEKRKYSLISRQYKAFNNIVEKLIEMHIKVILVQVPITKIQNNSIQNNTEVDSLFNSHATYINFNKFQIFEDDRDFYDLNHLNCNGITKFNALLIDILKDKNINCSSVNVPQFKEMIILLKKF